VVPPRHLLRVAPPLLRALRALEPHLVHHHALRTNRPLTLTTPQPRGFMRMKSAGNGFRFGLGQIAHVLTIAANAGSGFNPGGFGLEYWDVLCDFDFDCGWIAAERAYARRIRLDDAHWRGLDGGVFRLPPLRPLRWGRGPRHAARHP